MTNEMKVFAEDLSEVLEKHGSCIIAYDGIVTLTIGDEDFALYENIDAFDIKMSLTPIEVIC